jgi:hypothetical protein
LLNKNSSQEASTLNSTMDAAKNTAVNTVQSETSTLATAVTGDAKVEGATSVPTSSNDKVMGGVPGGVSATATVVKNGASVVTTTPGIAPIATAVQNTAGAINRGAGAVVSGVQASVGVAGSALNLVNTIRSFAGLSALGGALGSISFPGGPFQTRAPIVAENTTNNTNQRVQAANLVGKGVPPPNFDGKTAKTPAEIEEENKKFTDIKTALAKRDEAFETWNTTRIAKGDNDSATVRAYAEYKAASDAADSLSA